MRTHRSKDVLGTIGLSLLLFVLITYSGCIATKSGIEGTPIEMSDFAPHLDTLKARYDLTETLKTTKMMVIIQEGNQSAEELREMLWYKKASDGGDQLRIQVLGVFDDTKAVAIANQDQFLLAFLDQREVYEGKLSDGILDKIFGIDLRVSDVLSAIFANPFLDGRTDKLKITRSGEKYIITRPGIEDEQTEMITLLVKEDEPKVTEWHITDNNGLMHQSAFFSDYYEVDGILRPHKVEIVRPLEQTRVAVKIAQVQLNLDIKDNKFDFEPFLNEDFIIKSLSETENTDAPE